MRRFEKQNPKIHVNLRVIDWNTLLQQVPAMISTHSYPDVLNFNAYSTFASQGLLRPAKQVLSPSVASDFVPSFGASDTIHGTQYGIPWIASVRARVQQAGVRQGRDHLAAVHLVSVRSRRAEGEKGWLYRVLPAAWSRGVAG